MTATTQAAQVLQATQNHNAYLLRERQRRTNAVELKAAGRRRDVAAMQAVMDREQAQERAFWRSVQGGTA